MHTYRRKTIGVLLILLTLFFLASIFAYAQYKRKIPILNIGLSYAEEDLIVLALSIASILRVAYELFKVEHHHEYERRLKRYVEERYLKK